jgi:hypothetical protein
MPQIRRGSYGGLKRAESQERFDALLGLWCGGGYGGWARRPRYGRGVVNNRDGYWPSEPKSTSNRYECTWPLYQSGGHEHFGPHRMLSHAWHFSNFGIATGRCNLTVRSRERRVSRFGPTFRTRHLARGVRQARANLCVRPIRGGTTVASIIVWAPLGLGPGKSRQHKTALDSGCVAPFKLRRRYLDSPSASVPWLHNAAVARVHRNAYILRGRELGRKLYTRRR